MTLGLYNNFPNNIHRIDRFTSQLPIKQLQQKLIRILGELNRLEFSFEEVANPTIPQGRVIFEFGLADFDSFNFIDDEEIKRILNFLAKQRLESMDFFCSIRYYKVTDSKKTALKFDYYMLRAIFGKNMLEVHMFHERGPRYVSPEEIIYFIEQKLNEGLSKKILRKIET